MQKYASLHISYVKPAQDITHSHLIKKKQTYRLTHKFSRKRLLKWFCTTEKYTTSISDARYNGGLYDIGQY